VFCEGIAAQIAWADSLADMARDGAAVAGLGANRDWSGTRMSDAETTWSVKSGELDIVAGYGVVATYGAGQEVTIPAGVLYAACPSPDCRYEADEGEG